MEIIRISPSEIEVGEDRLRKDLGDTEDLEKSIRKLGLLQPIGVTEEKKLVWGWRRLETWKKIKDDEPIPAIVFSEDLSRLAELAENICRLDLPWYLKDMAIAELHKKFEEEAIKRSEEEETREPEKKTEVKAEKEEPKPEESEFSPACGKKSNRGRPPEPWTQSDTAEVLGISQQKVSTALNLVEAMEKHPELKKAETEKEALRMLQKKLKRKEEKPEKEKTWKCDACEHEFSELDPVAPTRYTLCPDCLVEFETWKAEKLYDSDS